MNLAARIQIASGGKNRAPNRAMRRFRALAGRDGPIMLMYHSIEMGGGTPDWQWSVSFQRFVEQMDYLTEAGWSPVPLASLDNPEICNGSRRFILTFDDAYENTLPAYEFLAKRGWPASWFVVTSALGGMSTWRDPGVPQRPTMKPHHLRELRENGMEIGGHSHSHRWLAEAPVSELAAETAGCRKILEDLLGGSVDSFAYPYGSCNRTVTEAVRNAGYRRACLTDNGFAWHEENPFRLRRIAVRAGDTRAAFARKLIFPDDNAGLKGAARSALRTARRITGINSQSLQESA